MKSGLLTTVAFLSLLQGQPAAAAEPSPASPSSPPTLWPSGQPSAAAAPAPAPAPATAPKAELGDFGVDLNGMDKSVTPGDDFYRFANGSWDDRTEIPADKSSWGGFGVLRDLSDQRTRAILEDLPGLADASPDARNAGLLYRSVMDEAGIEKRGLQPLAADLEAIEAIASPRALVEAFARASRDGIATPIQLGISIDVGDPDRYLVSISQGGLGLPDRDYYLLAGNSRFAAARAAYQRHVAAMLTLAGVGDATAKAEAIVALETRIAQVQWSRVETRQAEKRYNPQSVTDLAARVPQIDWRAFLEAAGLGKEGRVTVGQPSAIAQIAQLVATEPLAGWKAYLAYRTISARADVLPKAFVEEDFAFQKVLSGTPELKARWKRGVDLANAAMGEAIGQIYVARHFPPVAKEKADRLVANLLIAMRGRLERVAWMAPETKAKALAKLAGFRTKIGYPDHWQSYAGLRIVGDDAYGNAVRATRFAFDTDAAKLGRPADRGEWHMTPQTVNAYANPVWTEIVFPAAILQPPFLDANADDAVNYGAIGAVIGHEISHHFDDQGRKYDASGRLANWWTADDVTRFKTYTDRVVAQYGAYQPLPGVSVNGALTLGENMADLAGVTVAYDAYRLSLGEREAATLDGYSGDQRFFLGFAQIYRNKMRDAALERQVTTDPHTPGRFRPYVVRNLDSWYRAFDVAPGSAYYLAPAARVKVW
jgi:putative endopeptidase